MSDLSLFGIDADDKLHELFEDWQAADSVETITAATSALEEYLGDEVMSIERPRKYMRLAAWQVQAAKEEAKRQVARQHSWQARYDRLAAFVMSFMKSRGRKFLNGEAGGFRIQGNGGLAPLVIRDNAMIPDEMCSWTITFPPGVEMQVVQYMKLVADEIREVKVVREPSNTAIRLALATDTGVPGAYLDERGEQLRLT